MHMKFK